MTRTDDDAYLLHPWQMCGARHTLWRIINMRDEAARFEAIVLFEGQSNRVKRKLHRFFCLDMTADPAHRATFDRIVTALGEAVDVEKYVNYVE